MEAPATAGAFFVARAEALGRAVGAGAVGLWGRGQDRDFLDRFGFRRRPVDRTMTFSTGFAPWLKGEERKALVERLPSYRSRSSATATGRENRDPVHGSPPTGRIGRESRTSVHGSRAASTWSRVASGRAARTFSRTLSLNSFTFWKTKATRDPRGASCSGGACSQRGRRAPLRRAPRATGRAERWGVIDGHRGWGGSGALATAGAFCRQRGTSVTGCLPYATSMSMTLRTGAFDTMKLKRFCSKASCHLSSPKAQVHGEHAPQHVERAHRMSALRRR